MRAVLLVALATGCGFQVAAGTGGGDAGIDAPVADAADAPIDQAIDAPRSWWDPAWEHRRLITIDNSLLTGSLASFPVLIRIPAASLMGIAQADCDDLRFVEADDSAVIALELDACVVGASGETVVWIERTLAPAGPAPTLWLYYGNAAAGRASNGREVFGTGGAGYLSVHHMGSNLLDVTDNGHGANANSDPTSVAGRISLASNLDGDNDYYQLSNGDSDYDFTTMMSASAWVKVDQFTDAWQAIIAKGDDAWRVHRGNTTNGAGFGTTATTGNPAYDNLDGSDNINDNAWHHVAVVYDGATKYLYVDGVEDEQRAYTRTLNRNNRSVRIGANQDVANRNWDGQIDEVRISAVPRTAAWIRAEYTTVTSATFVTIGADEPY